MVEKLLSIAVALSCLLSSGSWAATTNIGPSTIIATPPQPTWNELAFQQQSVLAPLASDWDKMENYRRKKWLGIAQRFATMTPAEQQRVQAQMYEWTKLTPQQRQAARLKYQTVNQLPPEKKQELKQQWEAYSSLPEDEKRRLQEQAAAAAAAATPKPGRHAAPAGVVPGATAPVAPAPAKLLKPADATVPPPAPAPLPSAPIAAEPATHP
ncbi:DUF3106 domain-containing protein [Rhodocyclus tenuis]|uniref:DUF3106 domain-containing protein n=2 Tax=Rhodocyclus TaxID=1064 RepID=A0A6L5JWS8_RHOTE|nr:DUF3106 domain-containing protein [Rhodocyclus gracilis]MQY51689.1 DUF3106 domain-containing protein [Rhodocyclus gracilis]MRD73170.1 DUF3106 domain-containing protein [Rhodocyclus gracilis]NJA89050.1 DUF3106 domain-containing protein [Rhodocyclus gracilis]